MKNLFYTCSAAVAMMFAFSSCDNGNADVDILNSPPGIALPETLSAFAGSQQTVTVNFTEGSISQLTTGTVTLSQGDNVIETVTQSMTGTSGAISLTFNVNNPGIYTLSATASDDQGETSSTSADLSISCEPPAACVADGAVTFIAIVPGFTTGTVGMVGSLTGWGGDADIAFTQIGSSSCFCAAVPEADLAGAEFKFRLDANWDRVEKATDCSEVDNRTSTATAGDVVSITIDEWRNSDSFGGGCPN